MRTAIRTSLTAAGTVLGLLALLPKPASAAPTPESGYTSAWNALYLPSASLQNVVSGTGKSCQLCHASSGGGNNYNTYGWRIRQFMSQGASISSALAQAESFDSDGDPTFASNIQEILASTQPGWTPGNHNTTYSGSTPTPNQPPPAAILGNLDPAPGDIDVSPLAIGFPMVEVGALANRKVTVSNTGLGIVTVTSLVLSGASFVPGSAWPAVPFAVTPGVPIDLVIRYQPAAKGAASGTLTIGSNDPDEPSIAVALAANAYERYGCGSNPPGSLVHISGKASVGMTWTLGVDNPLGTQAPGSFALLVLATAPAQGFPCGLPLPGFGMGAPGASGELLVSVTPPDPVLSLGPALWTGAGNPAALSTVFPNKPGLIGAALHYQGVIVDPSGAIGIGLTEGLIAVLAP